MAEALGELRALFSEALDRATPQEQADYLERACQGRPALRARVEALLRAHAEAGGFLQEADGYVADRRADAAPLAGKEGPGTQIGPYQLLEPVGEGGMGVVWLAEQHEPVRRRVALKVLKPGLDSKTVLARFEAERQALALMDHPHIAKILDAGTTESEPSRATGEPSRVSDRVAASETRRLTPLGSPRPYFVMELVKGVPITRFCDEQRLTLRQRLELFVPVCHAIQHAHTKGIIHRDVKPSNVLVACYDGVPVPKVIDFGIAKATGQRLTEQTLVTSFGQVLGTLEYMSPEQAEFNALDIDTRSDIYSLGVLLYELLTGSTPLGHERLRETPLPELLRLIREEEAPKPSTRLSRSETLPGIAAARQTEPAQLSRLLRGELDWIVLKALEKDRNRRYETATSLARDVERYLRDEPVEACPPSAGYRLRKFAWKYRRPLATAAAFGALLLGGGAVAGWQAVRLARTERDQAIQQARRSQDVQAALSRAAELRGQARSAKAGDLGKWAEALAMAERAEALLEGGPVEPELAERVSDLRRQLDREHQDRRMLAVLDDVRLRQADVKGERFDMRGADRRYAAAFRQYGLDLEALPEAEAVRQLREAAIREELLAALDNWIWYKEPTDPERTKLRAVADGADDNAWRRDLREAAGRRDGERLLELAKDARAPEQPPAVLALFGEALQVSGRPEEAADWLRQAQQRHGGDFWLHHHLAYVLFVVLEPPRTDEAVGHFRATAALRPDSPGVHYNLGNALREQGNLPAAIASYRQALDLDPRYASAHANLGVTLRRQGDPDGAAVHFRQALELAPKHALARTHLGVILQQQGDRQGAASQFRQAIADDPTYARAHNSLGALLDSQGDPAGAAACFRQALEHDPNYAPAHYNLGIVLRKQGDPAAAAASFRRATELQPDYLEAHYELGRTLQTQQDYAAALASYRRVLELKPNDARAHYSLGFVLGRQGDLAGAAASYRKAIAINPQYAEAHCDLGNVLITLGELREALEALRTGHELGSQRKGWRNPSAAWIKDCERLLELEGRLPAVLKGNVQPANAAERIELADVCRYKRLYTESVRLFTEAFADDAALAADTRNGHRYRAAGSAALAGCGQGAEAARLDDADRAALRRQALEWLRADLAGRAGRLESGKPQGRQAVRAALRYWQADAALTGVRDAGPLAGLPAEERAAWQQLWADVAAVLPKTQEPK